MRKGPRLILLAAGVVLLAAGAHWLASRGGAERLASGEAQWIWAAPDRHGVVPLAFQAARDFTLEAPLGEAWIRVLADEEYVLYLNGVRVGGGRYRPGAGLDTYRVGPLLVAGANRLLVEARAGRRAGGLLLRLSAAGGLEVVTGPDWSILLRHRERHLDPASPLEQEQAPWLWGRPPTGRWGRPAPGAPLPLYGEVVAGERRQWPRRIRVDGVWREARQLQPSRQLRASAPSLGRLVTFDWGRPVTGYPTLFFVDRKSPKALLYFGCDSLDSEASPDDRALGASGRLLWSAALPRRFRCLTVLAPDGIRGAFVDAVDESRAAPLLAAAEAAEGPAAGVLGLERPPELMTPVEDEIRRELQGLPGLVVGQPG